MKQLIVEIPEELKYRLDMTVLLERTTIKEKVTKLLEDNLPTYEPIAI
jgi:hypothetical protein